MINKHSLRTENTSRKYVEHIASGGLKEECVICVGSPIVMFVYWKIIKNKFPYDRIAEIHHMLVPIRHCTEDDLSNEELDELRAIKNNELAKYHYLVEAITHTKSVPEHFHFHVLQIKDFSIES